MSDTPKQFSAWCSQHQMHPSICFDLHHPELQQRPTQTLKIRHNMEVAHRLSQLPGKCEQIHGHSMWVVAELEGAVNSNGILLGMDFGKLKAAFRGHLDDEYDHHLLLNKDDPWAHALLGEFDRIPEDYKCLPGLRTVLGDPTTENIAKWIGAWCRETFKNDGLVRVKVEVWETQVNSATWEDK